MDRSRTGSATRRWTLAAAGTLVLHLGIAFAGAALDPFSPRAVDRAEPDPVQLVFAPAPEEPTRFTELPPDRADEPPERAEFLSNVDSRARDRDPGEGTDGRPRQEGRADSPQVRIDAGESAPPPVPPTPAEPAAPDVAAAPAPGSSILERVLRREATDPAPTARPTLPGLSDLAQEAMTHPSSDAALTGDISLSTTAWEYAPWLLAFRRAVRERWHAPGAYHLGLIHGWVTVDLDVALDGTLRDLRVVRSEVGHSSLEEAAVWALRAAAPYRSLPADFPDESLILRIRFSYPDRAP
jgi:outer membrane biosynthesis protein TonB